MGVRSFMVALCAVAAIGCERAGADRGSASDDTPSRRFEHDMMVRFHMRENFGLLRGIEKLLVWGKLHDAQLLARAMADAPDEPGLGAFAVDAEAVRTRAAELATSATIDGALRAEAKLAGACAACHASAGALPDLGEPPRPPRDDGSVTSRMARHLWATDRLWEGAIASSDQAWRAGLDVLAATPLPTSELGKQRAPFGRELQRLADGARRRSRTDTAADRIGAYGDILVTCASCHAAAPR